MKTIGLIGGMSWESTIPYYAAINEYVKGKLGGLHSAKIVLYSIEFAELEKHMSAGEWDDAAAMLSDAARRLEGAGAELILICTNTLHKVYDKIQAAVGVPIIHIAEATADALCEAGVKKVALLGTKYTMTGDFYRARLNARGFEVVIPNESDVELVNDIIFKELCVGEIKDESRRQYARVIAELKEQGAQAVIFGCTEIGLLITQEDSVLPAFDTTIIHARRAAQLALAD